MKRSAPADSHELTRDSDVLDVKAASALLGISRSQVYALIARKEIPHVRISARVIRLRREGLLNWLRQCEEGGFQPIRRSAGER